MVTVSNSTTNEILTIENVKITYLMKRLEGKKKVKLFLEYLFMKNKKNYKGMGEVKIEIPLHLKEHPNLENISNVFTATSLAT